MGQSTGACFSSFQSDKSGSAQGTSRLSQRFDYTNISMANSAMVSTTFENVSVKISSVATTRNLLRDAQGNIHPLINKGSLQ